MKRRHHYFILSGHRGPRSTPHPIISLMMSLFLGSLLGFNQAYASSLPLVPDMSKNLRVGVLNTPPYSYYVKGKPIGIAYDLWSLIARDNAFNCQYIDIGNDIDAAASKIASGEIDVALGQMVLLSSREKQGYFSLPFFRSEFVLLTKKVSVSFLTRLYNTFKGPPIYLLSFTVGIYMIYIILFYLFEHKLQPELIGLNRRKAFELILWRHLLFGLRKPPFFPMTSLLRTLSLVWTLFLTILLFSVLAGMTSVFISGWTSAGQELIHISDLDNKFVDAEGGDMAVTMGLKVGLNVISLQDNTENAVKRLDNQVVSAIFMTRAVAVTYLKTHPRDDLYISTIKLPSYSVGYLFNDKYENLLRGVNYSILKTTETGEKILICKKYLGSLGESLCL